MDRSTAEPKGGPAGLTVRTESGEVAGLAGPGGIRIWKGVPFAAPPVGELRWRPPALPMPWSGVREAAAFGPDCPQPAPPGGGASGSRASHQSEDCLHLNIWAPPARPGESLPVMVWLFGGSFLMGSPSDTLFDGEKLASRGVILITANYRVGLFGFLAHPALTAESPHRSSSNYALLDQLATLRWIRDNIAAFGGDPKRVTLFGVSAGSASISLLLTSPLAKGMFQQAILESPGAFRTLASLGEAEAYGLKLGADLAALRRMSAEELIEKTPLFVPKVRGLTTPRVLRPIRDGWIIPEDERDAFAANRFHPMPIIVGANRDEGSNFVAAWPINDVAAYRAFVAENFGPASEEALTRYPVAEDSEVRGRLAELFADTQFNYGVWALSRAMARGGKGTWRYLFLKRRAGQTDGPHHGDEVPFVFGALDRPTRKGGGFDAADVALSERLMAAWVKFAQDGNPAGEALDWKAYDSDLDNYLEFGEEVREGAGWRSDKMVFLDRFFATRGVG
ncbi:MAG: carboxylesterase/lipase family protein [Stellaceae bacterium]